MNCPICNHPNTLALFHNNYERSVWQCQLCTHVWADGKPHIAATVISSKSDHAKIIQDEIKELSPQAWLDVGPSRTHHLLSSYRCEIRHGVDPVAIDPEDGITFFQSEWETFKPDRRYDVISITSTLEHIADPVRSLVKAFTSLRPNGYLLICVPWGTRPVFLFPDWFSREHLHYFSVTSLAEALKLSRFEPTKISTFQGARIPFIVCVAQKNGQVKDRERIWRSRTERDRKLADAKLQLSKISGMKVVVWGAGDFSKELLNDSPAMDDVLAFIDSDPNKHGSSFMGRCVFSPMDIEHLKPQVVLIGSMAFSEEIRSACGKYDSFSVFQ